MWVVCKRRKIDRQVRKRKIYDEIPNSSIKRQKLFNTHRSKRKLEYEERFLERRLEREHNKRLLKRKLENGLYKDNCWCNKRQKVLPDVYCLIHTESYICDIYECSGVKILHLPESYHMPYII